MSLLLLFQLILNASKNGNYVFHYNCPVLIVTANKKDYGNNMADCACALEAMRGIGLEDDERVYGALAVGFADTEDGLPIRKSLERTGNKVSYVR